MSTVTSAPVRRVHRTPAGHDTGPNRAAKAIMESLRRRDDHPGLSYVAVHGDLDDAIRCHRMSRHDSIADADRLLGDLLFEFLPGAGGERQVLHDDDPAGALIELSRSAGLLVVGARSRPSSGDEILSTTATALLANTRCPLAVLPH